MLELLWLIPALPFAGFLFLALFGKRCGRGVVALAGCGSVGLSALIALGIAGKFLIAPPEAGFFQQTLWTWMDVGGLTPVIGLHLDTLSLLMVLVVTVIGFLIHLYSTEFMADEEGYSRFFAYMNLFVGFMLTLVLADNLLMLLVGWEGVGLCSYLLIGFWYSDPANGRAARKAFVVTRVGDTALIIGLFLLFHHLGTLDIQQLLQLASEQWETGSALAVAVAALLLGGAVGKSAQLPLQTWLPEAMAGPTPVSALIHAATMVTAGVYLIARTHVLFELAPAILTLVAVVGAITLLLSGFSALVQRDIKRVLAYSTISQIGYMFLALGVGAWSAAMFHFMTHACFKALLFLGAGAVIHALDHEHDMFKMGGLRTKLPLTFWTFVIGAASLASLPLVTAGFYSKEFILRSTFASEHGQGWMWGAALLGALVTVIYTARMVVLTFFGEAATKVSHQPGKRMSLVLVILAALSTLAGFLETPETLGHVTVFSRSMEQTLPAAPLAEIPIATEVAHQLVAAAVVFAGILVTYLLYHRKPHWGQAIAGSAAGRDLRQFWLAGWGFDWLYERLLVRPFVALARLNHRDVIDRIYDGLALLMRGLHFVLSQTQTGHLRWYAMGISLGTIVILAIVLLL